MKDTLYQKLVKHNTHYLHLKAALSDENITRDLEHFKNLSKEYAKLKPLHEGFEEHQQLQQAIKDNAIWLNDHDTALQSLAIEENKKLLAQAEQLARELEIMLIPEDPDDKRNVFIEIRAAAGGAEAAIFVGDLLRMYLKYAEEKKWSVDIISSPPSEQGGYKEVTVKLTGQSVYSHLKFESGTHRVQRVPETEAQGRLHTSTCTVAVLPEVETIDAIHIKPDELRIDTFRASGAGGQHVQKTDSAIRITHLPTKLKVECQDERSQHKNRERALSLLQARLLAKSREEQHQAEAATRKNLIGSGNRSERIRTYNIPQGRLTDHRIPLTLYQLDAILEGNLSLILNPLRQYYQLEVLKTQAIDIA